MIAVFDQTMVGKSACLSAKGTQPAVAMIDFGNDFNSKSSDYGLTDLVGSALAEAWDSIRDTVTALGTAAGLVIGQGAGTSKPPQYSTNGATRPTPNAAYNSGRAGMSLKQMIFPLGLITGISIDYSDSYSDNAHRILTLSTQRLGVATITGVTFERTCEQGSSTNTAGVMQSGEHGLERILEYYYNNRVSNQQKKAIGPSVTKIKIGNTNIDGWVVGLTVQPQNFDYRIWQWALKLAITPQFEPGGLKKGRGN